MVYNLRRKDRGMRLIRALACERWYSIKKNKNKNKKWIIILIYIYIYIVLWIMVRVFVNGPGDLGSIQGRVKPKTQKWYLIPLRLTLSIISYGSRVKWNNQGKGIVPSPISLCSSYPKGSLRDTLDYGRHLYFIYKSGLWFLLAHLVS